MDNSGLYMFFAVQLIFIAMVILITNVKSAPLDPTTDDDLLATKAAAESIWNPGKIAGVIIGSLIGVVFLVGGVYLLYRKYTRNKRIIDVDREGGER